MDTPQDGEPRAATPGGSRLTRRELLLVGAAVTVAGCAPTGSRAATPTATRFFLARPATLYADGTVPQAVARGVFSAIGGLAGVPSASATTTPNAKPDLVLTYGALPTGYTGAAIGASPVAVITHMRVPVDAVSADQLRALLTGAARDWTAAGAPYALPVRLFTLGGLAAPTGVSSGAAATTVKTPEDLLTRVRTTEGSLALAPLELPDWTVRNLGVAGIYPVQGRGDLTKSPLAPYTLQIGVSDALARQGLDPRRLAAGLSGVLVAGATILDIAAAGDIMLGRGVNNKMVAYNDYRYPYRKIHDELQAADLRVANLECTVTDTYPIPTDPFTFTFVSKAKAIDGLTYAGFQGLTVANNHANGPGYGPFMDMVNNLRQHGIAVCGGGKNLQEATSPALMEAKGVKVALLGYCQVVPQGPWATASSWGLAPANLETLPREIAAARKQADLVIPYFHWGTEYQNDPHVKQQEAGRAAIDAGADMVLGVHPHWVQAIENYRGKLIVYSLGNFIFDQDWSRPTMEGMLLHMYWRGTRLVGVRWVPVIDRDRCQPNVMSPAEAVGDFDRMWSGTDLLASGQYGPEP